MARPPKLIATVMTSLLSLLVLGGVWGAVVILLPQNQDAGGRELPTRLPLPSPSETISPAEAGGFRTMSPALLPPPDPLPLPSPTNRTGRSPAPVALNLEIRCEAEMENACPEGSIEERRQCLQTRFKQLSAPCQQRAKEQLVRMKVNLQHIRASCEEDVNRFCREVPLGGGAALQCLEAHAQDVSDKCFQALPKRGRLLNY